MVSSASIQNPQQQYYPTLTAPQEIKVQPKTLERTPEVDTVDISKPKKKLSSSQKWTIGISSAVIGITTAGILIARHQGNKIGKLYKDKLVLSNLGENIVFKEAATIEEGIKFAKEVLKIKDIDSNFTLEAINWINKGLVDVSNANKGKVVMPTALRFNKQEGSSAYVVQNIKSKQFGEMGINKEMFDHNWLDNKIKSFLGIAQNEGASVSKKSRKVGNKRNTDFVIDWSNEFRKLADRFIENPANLTIAEKRYLMESNSTTSNIYHNLIDRNPLKILEKNMKLFNQQGITYDIVTLKKLSLKDQCAKLDELLAKYKEKSGICLGLKSLPADTYKTIYHEMGHLQDFYKNLPEIHIKQENPFKGFWKDFKQSIKTGKNKPDRAGVDEIDNRWGGKTYKGYEKLLKDEPEKFKKLYPDLYEHLTNPEIQSTAGEISEYAQTSIGEFIAETYARLISGKKVPDKVMDLYKKYGGPGVG